MHFAPRGRGILSGHRRNKKAIPKKGFPYVKAAVSFKLFRPSGTQNGGEPPEMRLVPAAGLTTENGWT